MVGVSILERKRLDLRHVLEVQYDREGFAYLDIRERPIKLIFGVVIVLEY